MNSETTPTTTWSRLAGISGVLGVLFYFAAAFLPGPEALSRLLAFAFGPLLAISFLGLYRTMARRHDGPLLQIAFLFAFAAGLMVTTMLVVQVGNNMVLQEALAEADGETGEEAARLAWRAVNRVQYLLDVVWDIFICIGTFLFGVAMLRHPRFGKIWGGLGILASTLLLALNLQTFPTAPAYAGSIDVGPVLALWCLAVSVRMLLLPASSADA